MKKFCPKCGITISKGVFCNACNPVSLEFKPIKIKLCPSNKYFFKGKWKKFDSLRKLTELIVDKSFDKDVALVSGLEAYPDLLSKTGMKKDFDIIVSLDDVEFLIPVNVFVTTSPSFSKVGSTYFEGILQLRNADLEVKNFVNGLVNETEDLYVNKVVETDTSVDLYFVKKKFIGRIADKIISKYGGLADHNAQLFTQDKQTSKELFRLNVAVHVPPFRKGDVILKNDSLLLVTNTNKIISVLDLENKKNVSFKYDPSEVHIYKKLEKQKTSVINTHPLSALSKESYEVVELENPQDLEVKKNQAISIVEHKGRSYLIK